jgi:hypothetical protein
MYYDVINSFVFFKNNSNIDFINRVLIAFKPTKVFKNEILLKDGDYVEETIFVKDGILSIEISMNSTNLSTFDFIKKQLDESNPISEKFSNSLKETILHKIQNMSGNIKRYIMNDTIFLKILQIKRNEYFGDVLMLLNRTSIFRIRVTSKNANLFLLNKLDLLNISKDFPEIFIQIYNRSVYNMDKVISLIEKAKIDFYKNNSFSNNHSHINKLVNTSQDDSKFNPIKFNQHTNSIKNFNSKSLYLKRIDTEESLISIANEKIICNEIILNRNEIKGIYPAVLYKQNNTNIDNSISSIADDFDNYSDQIKEVNTCTFIEPNNNDSLYMLSNSSSILMQRSKDDNIVKGYFLNNANNFIIIEGFIQSCKCNTEPINIKIISMSWLKKEVDNTSSFTIEPQYDKEIIDFSKNMNPSKRTSRLSNLVKHTSEDFLYTFPKSNTSKTKLSLEFNKTCNKNKKYELLPNIPTNDHYCNNEYSRRQSMFLELKRNIEENSQNLNDPSKFYKHWLLEIHNKHQERKKVFNGKLDRLNTKLDKIINLFKEKYY